MELWEIFQRVGIAIGLGLLVGLQRERTESKLAGIRTFPLITALGALAALVGLELGGWTVAAGLLAVAALLVMGNLQKFKAGDTDVGLTTEMAVLLMYAVGAYAVVGRLPVAIAVGGTVVVLLHYREPLHAFVQRIGAADVNAIMRFVLIALIILPVLPDQAYGPFKVLNPRQIWLMVVLIVGIGLAGYVAYKLLGGGAGALVTGILGGVISSTATAVSFARRSRHARNGATLGAVVIIVASAVSFARITIEIAVVAPAAIGKMGPPLVVMLVVLGAAGLAMYILGQREKADLPMQENPAELKPALVFGALYAAVIFLVAATKHYFGQRALYGVAVASGLTDLDAITLSTAQLVKAGRVDAVAGWRLILVAALSALVFKGAAVAVLGNAKLARRVGVVSGIALVAGAAVLFLWPDSWQLQLRP